MKRLWWAFWIVIVASFTVLGWVGGRIYQEKPPIPDTSQRHFARGEAALELGQTPTEFLDAAIEYENALRIAPW